MGKYPPRPLVPLVGGRPNGPAARRSLRDFRDWRGDEITDSAYPSLAPHPAITAEDQTIYGSGSCYKVFFLFFSPQVGIVRGWVIC